MRAVVPATLFLEPGGSVPLTAVVGPTGGGAVRRETSDARVITVSGGGARSAVPATAQESNASALPTPAGLLVQRPAGASPPHKHSKS